MPPSTADPASIAARLSRPLLHHLLAVAEASVRVASRMGKDGEKAAEASLLHDLFRGHNAPDTEAAVNLLCPDADELEVATPEIMHGPLAAAYAEARLGITDPEIISAVRYHSTGRPAMTDTEMILFLADRVSLDRNDPAAGLVRAAVEESAEKAVRLALSLKIRHLEEKSRKVHPRARAALDYYGGGI